VKLLATSLHFAFRFTASRPSPHKDFLSPSDFRMKPRISIKRVYEPASTADGKRILAERLWPRGIKKESLKLERWMREVAPSTQLRKWFAHDPAKWAEFQKRYAAELDASPEAWMELLQIAKTGAVTLLYSSRDSAHNNVVALREYLETKMKKSPPKTS
jgi:uncharacterized protein YeaO (DUF488 family)